MEKFKRILSGMLRYVVATVSLSIVFYILFALVFSTAEERQLQRENNLYKERYRRMQEKEELIGDVLDGLLAKDNAIYSGIFETQAPSLDAMTAADLLADSDSLSESFYLSATASASGKLMLMAANVDENFAQLFDLLVRRPDSIPPLTLPLRDFSYAQTGASVGLKHNPVYKLAVRHDGLDLIAPQGAPVYAAGDGVVSHVIHSRKGLGNMVVIDHGNGYSTRYCLLGDISTVAGRRVRTGQKIGTVGISSSVTAPHLHFEVRRGDEVKDPVHYLFASLSPEEYDHLVYLAARTAQSLD